MYNTEQMAVPKIQFLLSFKTEIELQELTRLSMGHSLHSNCACGIVSL